MAKARGSDFEKKIENRSAKFHPHAESAMKLTGIKNLWQLATGNIGHRHMAESVIELQVR